MSAKEALQVKQRWVKSSRTGISRARQLSAAIASCGSLDSVGDAFADSKQFRASANPDDGPQKTRRSGLRLNLTYNCPWSRWCELKWQVLPFAHFTCMRILEAPRTGFSGVAKLWEKTLLNVTFLTSSSG